MTYSQELKSPLWQRRKLEIITRDNCTCTLCSDNNTPIQIHHKYYKPGRKPWEYPDEALQSLCKDCHQCVEILKETGSEPLTAIKLINPDHPQFIMIFLVHHRDKDVHLSIFSNPTHQNKFEHQTTFKKSHILKMNEILLMAENLI